MADQELEPRKVGRPKKEVEKVLLPMPVLHIGNYILAPSEGGITAKEKSDFLEKFYETGNETLSAKFVGRALPSLKYHFKLDPIFHADFVAVKDAMKHNLEQTMYQNGLTTRGFMDRMAWLRKNYPQEYNPNADHSKDPAAKDVVQELANKLKDYNLIPKKDVIEVDEKE